MWALRRSGCTMSRTTTHKLELKMGLETDPSRDSERDHLRHSPGARPLWLPPQSQVLC